MKNGNFKKTLGVAGILQALLSTSALGIDDIYTIDDFNRDSYRKHYNKLSDDVDGRREALRKSTDAELHSKFRSFLQKAGELAREHNLQNYIGFRLIHRHFEVGENQVLSEQKNEGTGSLITGIQDIDEAKENGAVPASWIFRNSGKVRLFEVSNDEAVIKGNLKLKANTVFVDQMQKLMIDAGMNDYLALAIVKRKSLVPNSHQVFSENNDTGLSCVTLSTIDPTQKGTYASTGWRYNPSSMDLLQYLSDETQESEKAQPTHQSPSELNNAQESYTLPEEGFRIGNITGKVERVGFKNGSFFVSVDGQDFTILKQHEIKFPSPLSDYKILDKFIRKGGFFRLGQLTEGEYSIQPDGGLRGGGKKSICVKGHICMTFIKKPKPFKWLHPKQSGQVCIAIKK